MLEELNAYTTLEQLQNTSHTHKDHWKINTF